MSKSKILQGKSFVVTGTLSVPRKEFVDFIESHGGTVASNVSRTTSFLVLGNLPSGGSEKLLSSERLKIDSISENDVHEMIRLVKPPPPSSAAATITKKKKKKKKNSPMNSTHKNSDDDDYDDDDDNDEDYMDLLSYGNSTGGFRTVSKKKRVSPPSRTVTAGASAAAAATSTATSFKPKPSSSATALPRNFIDLSRDDDDDEDDDDGNVFDDAEEQDNSWQFFNDTEGMLGVVGKSSSLPPSMTSKITTVTAKAAVSGSNKSSSTAIDLLTCDEDVLNKVYPLLPNEQRKKVFKHRRANRQRRIKDLHRKKVSLENAVNCDCIVDMSPVTIDQLEKSFTHRSRFGKNPIYVAKCSSGTEKRESMGPFVNRDNPIILDKNGNKFTQSTLPEELKWKNVVSHRLYESFNQTNAFIVELAHQEMGGLSLKYLIQGFGYGSEEVDA